MIRRLLGVASVVALCALPARGGSGSSQLSVSALHVLTSIDSLPSKDELVTVFAPDPALDRLKQIIGPASSEELGVQLRAIRALPQFCVANCAPGDAAGDAIRQVITTTPLQPDPDPVTRAHDLLRLRAAIEALGIAKVQQDEALLAPLLEHPNRDVRVTTAKALRALCNKAAIVPLRARYANELVPQVRLAISAAIGDLGTCL
jgi:HEAT repeat protein